MKKKLNPGAGRNGTEVGVAATWWPHPDLTPLRSDLKRRRRYRLHVFAAHEYEAPLTTRWANRSVTVAVVDIGDGWIDERTWTFDLRTVDNLDKPILIPVPPPGQGWTFERRVKPRSSSWRRRREMS